MTTSGVAMLYSFSQLGGFFSQDILWANSWLTKENDLNMLLPKEEPLGEPI